MHITMHRRRSSMSHLHSIPTATVLLVAFGRIQPRAPLGMVVARYAVVVMSPGVDAAYVVHPQITHYIRHDHPPVVGTKLKLMGVFPSQIGSTRAEIGRTHTLMVDSLAQIRKNQASVWPMS